MLLAAEGDKPLAGQRAVFRPLCAVGADEEGDVPAVAGELGHVAGASEVAVIGVGGNDEGDAIGVRVSHGSLQAQGAQLRNVCEFGERGKRGCSEQV